MKESELPPAFLKAMNRPKTLQEPKTAREKAKRIRAQQCPQCGSLQWSLLGSARQCHNCGGIWPQPPSTSEGHATDSDSLNCIPESDQARQKLLRTAANFQAVEEMGAVPEVLRRMQKREKDAHNPPPASQEPLSCHPEPKEAISPATHENRHSIPRPEPKPSVRDESLAKDKGKKGHTGRVSLVVVSYRRRLIDTDNLTPKFFVDACRYAGFIKDDRAEDIEFSVRQEKVASKELERTEITIKSP